ncbi:GNAT family N-acetyltransferase [Bifidobacterium catulorum]|uniref:GNAT family N-acetyltransferase n=1 Tax=Bifidobacterium catulorum TaxID=1630173 RepID=A0A2U2MVK8_9BIFI|nr:GNAT family N-acetyltransferase [Bifidobacterium catulorum]
MVIRDAGDEDLDDITRIYNMAVVVGGSTADLTPRNLDQRREWVYSHNPRDQYPVVVVEVDGKVAGFASLSRYHARAGYSDITEFSYYVDKAFARQGLGSMLVEWLIEAATRIGFRIAVCVVFADNAGSTALMHRFGFERYGYLPKACCNGDRLLDVAYWYKELGN